MQKTKRTGTVIKKVVAGYHLPLLIAIANYTNEVFITMFSTVHYFTPDIIFETKEDYLFLEEIFVLQ